MAVYRPRSGVTPLAIANAMASGRATMPTMTPATRSLKNWSRVYPCRVVKSFGTSRSSFPRGERAVGIQPASSFVSRNDSPSRAFRVFRRVPSLRRHAMHHFQHQCTVQRTRERARGGKTKPGERIGRVARVPHEIDVVPDQRNPVESQVEVGTLALVVVLNEAEQAGPRIEIVFDPVRGENGGEPADREPGGRPRQVGAQNDVPATAPRGRELEIGAVTAVKLSPVHEGPEAERAARVHEVLELCA